MSAIAVRTPAAKRARSRRLRRIAGSTRLARALSWVAFLVIWFRVSWPRLREDQLQKFAWKYLIPLSLVLVLATGAWILYAPEAIWR